MDPESFMREVNKGSVYMAVDEIQEIGRRLAEICPDFVMAVSYSETHAGRHAHDLEAVCLSNVQDHPLYVVMRKVQIDYGCPAMCFPEITHPMDSLCVSVKVYLNGNLGERTLLLAASKGVIEVR